jgi:hypothetical protein
MDTQEKQELTDEAISDKADELHQTNASRDEEAIALVWWALRESSPRVSLPSRKEFVAKCDDLGPHDDAKDIYDWLASRVNAEPIPNEALSFLKRARSEGRIICSGDLTRFQIAEAQAKSLFYVDPDGFGYAIWPWDLTTDKDQERMGRLVPQPATPTEPPKEAESKMIRWLSPTSRIAEALEKLASGSTAPLPYTDEEREADKINNQTFERQVIAAEKIAELLERQGGDKQRAEPAVCGPSAQGVWDMTHSMSLIRFEEWYAAHVKPIADPPNYFAMPWANRLSLVGVILDDGVNVTENPDGSITISVETCDEAAAKDGYTRLLEDRVAELTKSLLLAQEEIAKKDDDLEADKSLLELLRKCATQLHMRYDGDQEWVLAVTTEVEQLRQQLAATNERIAEQETIIKRQGDSIQDEARQRREWRDKYNERKRMLDNMADTDMLRAAALYTKGKEQPEPPKTVDEYIEKVNAPLVEEASTIFDHEPEQPYALDCDGAKIHVGDTVLWVADGLTQYTVSGIMPPEIVVQACRYTSKSFRLVPQPAEPTAGWPQWFEWDYAEQTPTTWWVRFDSETELHRFTKNGNELTSKVTWHYGTIRDNGDWHRIPSKPEAVRAYREAHAESTATEEVAHENWHQQMIHDHAESTAAEVIAAARTEFTVRGITGKHFINTNVENVCKLCEQLTAEAERLSTKGKE